MYRRLALKMNALSCIGSKNASIDYRECLAGWEFELVVDLNQLTC